MKHRLIATAWGLLVALTPATALAVEDYEYDPRLTGYSQNVVLDSSSYGLTYLLLILLAAVCIGAMLKNARRSHLD